MDNRVRNESAFNELLEEIRRKSYFESLLSDLKSHYMNTNPFYLFSNQFHELILKLKAKLQNGNNSDIRKCMKELIQELTFYKIACPMKHLKLADSNIPNLVSLLKSQVWSPSDDKQSNLQLIQPVNVETNNSVNARANKALNGVSDEEEKKANGIAKKSIQQLISNNNTTNSKYFNLKMSNPADTLLRECKSAPLNNKSPEDVTKSIPNSASTANRKCSPPPDNRMFPTHGAVKNGQTHDSVASSKRKVGEIACLKEDEISRKKTSSGQNLVGIRKHNSEVAIPTMEHSDRVKETIFIMDDGDDDDVIIKSIISPVDKKSSVGKSLSSVPEEIIKKPLKTAPQKNEANSKISNNQDDDDIFIIEDVNPIVPGKNPSPPKRPLPVRQEEDVIYIQSYKLKPHDTTVPTGHPAYRNVAREEEACIVSHSH